MKKKKDILVEYISGLFILLFVYTAISKLSDHVQFRSVLETSPLLGGFAGIITWLLPVTELLTSILLFVPRFRRFGLLISFILMIIFTAYLSYMIATTSKLPCSCGGVLSQMTWQQHLVFNIFFSGLALLGLIFSKKKKEKIM